MIKVKENVDIKGKTTWNIGVVAKAYVEIQTMNDLYEFIKSDKISNFPKICILGRGANTLFADDFYDGLIIEVSIKGKEKIKENKEEEVWKIMAGEDWIELVEFFVDKDLGGLENLAYIPGKAGAAPVQNIAAYGKAFEEVCESVHVIDLVTGIGSDYDAKECQFTYRSSIFKNMINSVSTPFVISHINLRLTKPGNHKIVKTYHSMSEKMSDVVDKRDNEKKLRVIYDSVVSIRKSKLPDHNFIGTNGSLFVNPIVKGVKLKELLGIFPSLQFYPVEKMKYIDTKDDKCNIVDNSSYKIAAGHIFDNLGWKGKRVGNVGTWDKHALVLCNYGAEKPQEILHVIKMMQEDFHKATGIMLVPEINIIK